MAHLNIRSLKSSFYEFQKFILDINPDILAITETWLNQNDATTNYEIFNYNFFRLDRNNRGGGICVYIKKYLKAKILNIPKTNHLENFWINISFKKIKLGLGIIYKPPDISYTSFSILEEIIPKIYLNVDKIIITGDFNVDFNNKGIDGYYLENILSSFGLKQIISKPTRKNYSSFVCT